MRVWIVLMGYKGKNPKKGISRSKPLSATLLIWRDVFCFLNYSPKYEDPESIKIPRVEYWRDGEKSASTEVLTEYVKGNLKGIKACGENEMSYLFYNSREQGLPLDLSCDLISQVKAMLCTYLKTQFKEVWKFYYHKDDWRNDKIMVGGTDLMDDIIL